MVAPRIRSAAAALAFVLGGAIAYPVAQSVQPLRAGAITFQGSTDNFPNPERGFYRQFVPFWLNTERYPLDLATLSALRSDGISLIRTYYVFDEFRDTALPQAALDAFATDLASARQAGVKVIPRVAYSFPCATPDDPCTEASLSQQVTDPPIARVLQHIDQLTPVLRANGDVIAFMEMGFVGAWGEWHHSSSNLVNADRTLNGNSAAIVDRLLFALPPDRMAALRYPYHKQELFGRTPLDPAQAFSQTAAARLGAHNDCFLDGAIGGGTYTPPPGGDSDKTIEQLRQYLSVDTRYVPQGGETCASDAIAQPFIQCPYALSELAAMHWSTINSEYYPDVLDLWRRQGCYPEIEKRLGYRFRFESARAPAHVRRGARFDVSVTVVNDGWAAPFNPRPVELVLHHVTSGGTITIPIAADPRRWLPGPSYVLDVNDIPTSGVPLGLYDVMLRLPDADRQLARRPEYSIRLANDDVWDPVLGANRISRIAITAR